MKLPKNVFYDLIYFFFLLALYFFLRVCPQEEAFEMFSCSYLLFLQLLNRFSILMSAKGWKRLF